MLAYELISGNVLALHKYHQYQCWGLTVDSWRPRAMEFEAVIGGIIPS